MFKIGRAVKVIFQGPFTSSGDQQDIAKAGLYRLFNDILYGWSIYNRQHLFWHCFGGRQEPGSQPPATGMTAFRTVLPPIES